MTWFLLHLLILFPLPGSTPKGSLCLWHQPMSLRLKFRESLSQNFSLIELSQVSCLLWNQSLALEGFGGRLS